MAILYRSKRSVKVGELERYIITYEPLEPEKPQGSLWLKIRNLENITLRAAFLRGPYILYADVRSQEYHHSQKTFITADQPQFEPNLSPGQSFCVELSMHTLKERYVWIVDVVSQIIFSPTTHISFEVMLGSDKESLDAHLDKVGTFDERLTVVRRDTLDMWNLPLPQPNKPIHLAILTHGLHSNTGADMFYIKDQLDAIAAKTGENLIVRGYHGNVCKTERGVKYLGIQLAKYIVHDLLERDENITEISFIGHSLGGLIQMFALTFIELTYPWVFKRVKPVNFITLASPLLGIVTDNPAYVKAALMFGIVGRTGQDLGLEKVNGEDPLLKRLSFEPSTHKILKMFKQRTIYANSINDGIVPLYTSALLYLDWKGLSNVTHDLPSLPANSETGRIPDSIDNEIDDRNDMISKTSNSFMTPIQKAISLWTPNLQQKQTNDVEEIYSNSFPKTSMIESATAVLIPPLPSSRYLNDPSSRYDVIIHDRIYTNADIPPPEVKRKQSFIDSIDPLAKFKKLEEEIAKNWHSDLEWRKVLIKLNPDAHNNIFVRRRFSNAYGWPVIDHMIQEHFASYTDSKNEEEIDHPVDLDLTDFRLDNKDHEWITCENFQEGIFDLGPTGLITNFNEILDNFKNWNMALPSKSEKAVISDQQIEDDLEVNTYLSEGYIA